MSQYEAICTNEAEKLQKAFQHLIYSYQKIKSLSTNLDILDEDGLADWESFSARFSRVADMFLSKYLRARIMIEDPGFSGTMRDFVNFGEKIGLIDDARAWMAIRELRNITAHDYPYEAMGKFLERLRHEYARLLLIKDKII